MRFRRSNHPGRHPSVGLAALTLAAALLALGAGNTRAFDHNPGHGPTLSSGTSDGADDWEDEYRNVPADGPPSIGPSTPSSVTAGASTPAQIHDRRLSTWRRLLQSIRATIHHHIR